MNTAPQRTNTESEKRPQSRQSPLILLPGLGGDARLFSPQRLAFPELVVPGWIEPDRNESLADYAARLAKVIDPGCPCFIGGVSFGGVVALEVATHLTTRECYLLGSVRSPREFPVRLRACRPIADLVVIPKRLSPVALTLGGRWFSSRIRSVLHQLNDADEHFLRWAANAILKWKPSPAVESVRIVQIHGDQDPIFPISRIAADKTIRGAGHLSSVTHSDEVNQFVRERMIAASNRESEK